MIKTDPYDSSQFSSRRANQKFSSPQTRNAYHNSRAAKIRKQIAYIHKPLQKNLKILSEILPLGSGKKDVKVHVQFLDGKGYNFTVITHLEEYEGKKRWAIYNYLLIPIDSDNYKIVLIPKP